ncbi:uncharacterized protein LOC141631801 [Silene latifolia]|uniref:uncharacterized protein LOC141631801 n=1 Tax=Silene latifolia TaxID=37657 RepID=UPI003D787087
MQSKGRNDGSARKDQEHKPERDLPPPPPIYEVKFINGGSEICSLTSLAAMKVARETKIKSPFNPRTLPQITFDEIDMQGIPDLYHDGLVITMQLGTTRVLRTLIDGGSSVNLIILDVLKAMKISEDQITMKSSVLVGFRGATRNTLGEIYQPKYVKGVASYEIFGVLDCLSSYNAILGRPWIHNVKVIPSTYHQYVKIPAQWGITTIKGEQKSAQECYAEALKPTTTYPDIYVLVGLDALHAVRPDLLLPINSILTQLSSLCSKKRHKFAPERNTIINEEVDKHLDMGMIREVMYPEWLANVVVV